MKKFYVLVLTVVFLASCTEESKKDLTERPPSASTDSDNCVEQNTSDFEETDRSQPEDKDQQRDEATPADGEDDSKLLSDAAYQALIMAGIFVEEGEIFTTSYNEGYNLNFEITEQQARSLLPDNLSPIKIKLLQSDAESRYYLTWYMAVMDLNDGMSINRIDLFTYAKTADGEMTMFFVAAYMDFPEAFEENENVLGIFTEIFDFFARDSRTGKPAYPHYYPEKLEADGDTFNLVYGDSFIRATACKPVAVNQRFSQDFILVNSQIYRTEVDKNVNYFNQGFVNAKVEQRDLDCIEYRNLQGFHPMLEKLKSVHFYGTRDKAITWFYQMCDAEGCGNPFK